MKTNYKNKANNHHQALQLVLTTKISMQADLCISTNKFIIKNKTVQKNELLKGWRKKIITSLSKKEKREGRGKEKGEKGKENKEKRERKGVKGRK